MKRTLLLILTMLTVAGVFAADNPLRLMGRIKEAIGKTDLPSAIVLLYDSEGNVTDSIFANKGRTYRNGAIDTTSVFYMEVPRVDSTYVYDVVCPGYKTQTVSVHVEKIGKRERFREIDWVYMEREPKMLKELTVTSTKIKFYNKGDTVVYNADAFQLAEGSMLDALIAQLPGVELNNDGQIKVNGEFVESLLLNGREFMDGDNNLMLENIAAYTVKNVQVYEGQTPEAKRQRDVTARKVLTMDVRLKKEYSMGWILNAQGGYGTENRYLGKLYAGWFNTTTQVNAIANVNNLNDNRQPGRDDTWEPESMPSGKMEARMAGIDYNYRNPEETKSARGNFNFYQNLTHNYRSTNRTNFLPGGDTYDNSYSRSDWRQTNLNTNHSFYRNWEKVTTGVTVYGTYNHSKNEGSDIGGTFAEDPEGMTQELLEAIYSDGSPELLESIINRSQTRSNGWRKSYSGSISPYFSYTLPQSNDQVFLLASASYNSSKEELWRDYNINYGANPEAAVRRRQYTDNSPNHNLNFNINTGYSGSINKAWISIRYRYMFSDNTKDSYLYALERLNDMGIYGTVPVDYLQALDPANSYSSRQFENRHEINPMVNYSNTFGEKKDFRLDVRFDPYISIRHRKLNYWRNNQDYRLSKTNTNLSFSSIWSCMIEAGFTKNPNGYNYRHSLRYSYRMEPELPDMVDMLDIVNDADPLNIYLGNPDLKTQISHRHLVRWSFTPFSIPLSNIFYASYAQTLNSLTRGYSYDTSTGIRYNKMYNVDGVRSYAVTDEFRLQFGSTKQFTVSSETDANFSQYADMIGINNTQPELTQVNNRNLSEKFRFSWQIGSQTLRLRCDYTNRYTTSSQEGFNTISAHHINYGISGLFKLPAGFGISTDFTCYTRRGYGVSSLDTTDPVWNMRITYSHPNLKKWVFMVDGFDILHKLSNVNYAVSASGRTVTYTNTLPRYFLFSVQYRMSIQPKKK